ncbi:hypothetical protein [Chryseobacterium sp. FH1]|uniref:hypothetical protein n=1 Tax=Chryseobacterium sp. FH1 TaxID=1233951 RepID=UPI0004E2CF2C|nr:hypothetical protein [Chryseobacterium sp. FH1]KFC19342.1 hypothetical protein IO90_08520 [Chryseobacterium sp. FH1]
MNCDCFKNTAQKILDKETWEKREILDVTHTGIMYTFGNNAGKTGTLSYEEFELELEGLKKPKIVKVSHTFCPFCGVKAGKLDENEPDSNPLEDFKK